MFVKEFRRVNVRNYTSDLISDPHLKVKIETVDLHHLQPAKHVP